MTKKISIPLTDDRHITMKFFKINDHQYQCVTSEEYLTDIERFFNNGYYELDPNKQITVITKEKNKCQNNSIT